MSDTIDPVTQLQKAVADLTDVVQGKVKDERTVMLENLHSKIDDMKTAISAEVAALKPARVVLLVCSGVSAAAGFGIALALHHLIW